MLEHRSRRSRLTAARKRGGSGGVRRPRHPASYFFTHAFAVASHFMSFILSQSAFVLGASAANAGAATASKSPAMTAVLKILADMFVLLVWVIESDDRGGLLSNSLARG